MGGDGSGMDETLREWERGGEGRGGKGPVGWGLGLESTVNDCGGWVEDVVLFFRFVRYYSSTYTRGLQVI